MIAGIKWMRQHRKNIGWAAALLLVMLVVQGLWLRWRWRHLVGRALRLSPVIYRVTVEKGLHVHTGDGVDLVADHYAPRAAGDYPTVLIRSPYGRHARESAFGLLTAFYAYRFAERGYHVIVQDVRGRFESTGSFSPVLYEKADGLATLDWIRRQPWHNGQLGLWGGSYLGLVQWAIAPDDKAVGAMMPSITGSSLRDVIYPDGALDLGLALRWMILLDLLQGHAGRPVVSSLRMLHQAERLARKGFMHLPIADLDRHLLGRPVDFFQEWLSYEDEAAVHWQMLREAVDVARVEAPVHLVGGWYDFFLRPLLGDYLRLRDAGREAYLTIGPWHHFSTIARMPDLSLGVGWFDAQLKGERARLREKPVRLYVMGANAWRDFDVWPPPARPCHLHLQPGGLLATHPASSDAAPTRYRYDPMDPTPAVGGTQFGLVGGPRDNRSFERRPDVRVFTTAPLTAPVEVIGPVSLSLYVQSSLEFTDFYGRLCDVYPDGRSINLCDGLFRVKPGRGTDCGDGTRRIEIDLWATAHQFRAGHAIRLQVASGAHPRWSRNPGTGEAVAEALVMRPAEQVIYHDAAHPSALVLPVVEG